MAASAYCLNFACVFSCGVLFQKSYPRTCYHPIISLLEELLHLNLRLIWLHMKKGCKLDLKKESVLGDAISDLPHVENDEGRNEIPYDSESQIEF